LHIDQFNLVVSDMAASVAFYELLGLEVEATVPAFMAHHRTVKVQGGIDFDLDSEAFAKMWNPGWPGGAGGPMGVLGFRVDERTEVDTIAARMEAAGYRIQRPPSDAFWGSRYAIIEDPDGNAIGIMSPADEAFRSPPPLP